MSLIRPEAAKTLSTWAETLIGLAVLTLGLYWALTGVGLLTWVGWAVTVLGAALAFAGAQRARFDIGRRGPGIVSVQERRITYFGPLSGGVVDLDLLDSLAIDPSAKPAHWVLTSKGQPPVFIPLGAEGADALFDVFAQLPGLQTEYLLRQMKAGGDHPVVIWQSDGLQISIKRLH